MSLRDAVKDLRKVAKILDAATTEEATEIISANNFDFVYKKIAARASFRAERYTFQKIRVGTIFTNYAGKILGVDDFAEKFINK